MKKAYSNPYIAGIFLGIILFASFIILGAGLGSSAGVARISACISGIFAPEHTKNSAYFGKWFPSPLKYYLVYMFLGTIFGGLVSAIWANRVQVEVERGKACSVKLRVVMSLIGGILVGFSSRLASGCTSGQALTGGAMLLSGSIVFMICVFAGGYLTACFVRRQWND